MESGEKAVEKATDNPEYASTLVADSSKAAAAAAARRKRKAGSREGTCKGWRGCSVSGIPVALESSSTQISVLILIG